MGSLEKIDDNNFVIKTKTDSLSYEYNSNNSVKHLGYLWKLKRNYERGVAAVYLYCGRLADKFLSIDASVTINVKKSDGTVEVTKSFDTQFNQYNTGSGVPVGKNGGNDETIRSIGTDLEVYVNIKSITETQSKPTLTFEEGSDQLSDVALVVEGKELFVNKTVLATFSPVFRAMFFSGFKESNDKEVIINDVKYEDFKQFLQAVYSGYTEISRENIENLLILADRYDVESVMNQCEKYLQSTDKLHVFEKLNLAETYKMPEIYKNCMDSIDNKEKLKALCKFQAQFGLKTSQAVIKKFMKFH